MEWTSQKQTLEDLLIKLRKPQLVFMSSQLINEPVNKPRTVRESGSKEEKRKEVFFLYHVLDHDHAINIYSLTMERN